jgi:hypothetical protein
MAPAEIAIVPAWPPGLKQLLLLLEVSNSAFAGQARALRFRRHPPEAEELNGQILPAVVALVCGAARALAEGLGCTAEEILKLCDPAATAFQLDGARGVLRRLDRYWGSVAMATVEATAAMVLTWPGPIAGRVIALHGKVQVEGCDLEHHGCAMLPIGARLGLDGGALVLLRRTPVGLILETAVAAGLHTIVADCLRAETGLEAVVGPITLRWSERLATVNGRAVRLTALESRALRLLMQPPGQVKERAEMMRQLELSQARSLDRLILSLRDKLGDGLIATVYGRGYALENLEDAAGRKPDA